jgi:hypothetical protein
MPKFGLLIEYTLRTLQELFKNFEMPKFDLHIQHVCVNSWLFCNCIIVIRLYLTNFTGAYVCVVGYNFDSP